MAFDRMLADLQCNRNLAVAGAAPNQIRDLLFASGQCRAGRAAALPLLVVGSRETSSRIASFVQRRRPIALKARAASPAQSIEPTRSPDRMR